MNQKMNMSNMLSTIPLGTKVHVDFWSQKLKQKIRRAFILKEYAMPIRSVYPEFEKIEYEVLGGFVVMPLTLDHIRGYYAKGSVKKYSKIEKRHEPRLIISSILMGSY